MAVIMKATSAEAACDVQEPSTDRGYASLRLQLIILGLFRFSEALAWTTIFPYVFFMMQSFLTDGPKRDAQAAGYASLTVALFTFGEFLTSIFWAKVSDRLGRKPTLIIGVVGGSVSALAFGLSTNLWMALGARMFGGLVNPNVGVISACVGELVKRKEHQGKGFSVVPFLRGLGSLIGPVIGGHLADPVKNLPLMFRKGTLWEIFPYLFPNLVVAVSIMTSGLLGFFFLDESHPKMQNQPDFGRKISRCVGRKIRALFGQTDSGWYTTLAAEDNTIPLASRDHTEDEESLKEDYEEVETSSSPTFLNPVPQKTSAYTLKVILQILALSLLAFHKVSSDVIIPTFLATSSDKHSSGLFKFSSGFGLASPSIANVLLTQAVVAIISQILIVPRVIDQFGALKTFRWALFVFPWLYCLTPFTTRFPYPLSIMALLLDLWTKGVLVSLGYVASAILLTSNTPAPECLATVNGAAASIGCLARSIGAAVSGGMFHAGLTTGYIGLPFWTLGAIATAGAALSWCLDDKP
ncbi:MFS general substrate transporter [Acephala macrosclerotiorum]|nr:MFS general substrate transporter [Acephala macrosclerotiorum]